MLLRSGTTDKLSFGATSLVEFDQLPKEGHLFLIKHSDKADALQRLYNDVKATAHINLGHLTDLVEDHGHHSAKIVLYPPGTSEDDLLHYIPKERQRTRIREDNQATYVTNVLLSDRWDEELDHVASVIGMTRNQSFTTAAVKHLSTLHDVLHSDELAGSLPQLRDLAKRRQRKPEPLAS